MAELRKLENKKFIKEREKATEKGIVFGYNYSYKTLSFKKHFFSSVIPLKKLAKKMGGIELIQKHYNKIKSNLVRNEKIFNKNLEELGIKL